MPTDAQRKANLKMQSNKDRLSIWLNKDGTRDRYKAHAEKQGKSLNAYIIDLIEKDIQNQLK